MNDQPTTYGTTDLYVGAFLKARGIKLIDVDKAGRRITFLFEDSDKTKKLIKEFYNEGMVKISDFQHALKDLKSITYNMA
jgi:predicted transport protein